MSGIIYQDLDVLQYRSAATAVLLYCLLYRPRNREELGRCEAATLLPLLLVMLLLCSRVQAIRLNQAHGQYIPSMCVWHVASKKSGDNGTERGSLNSFGNLAPENSQPNSPSREMPAFPALLGHPVPHSRSRLDSTGYQREAERGRG